MPSNNSYKINWFVIGFMLLSIAQKLKNKHFKIIVMICNGINNDLF